MNAERYFREGERILVIGPHPDDEAVLGAGIIRRALLESADVQVAVVTNGDCDGKDRSLGVLRLRETVSAMEILGLGRERITAFGYPDTGGLEHWTRFSDSFLYRIYHAGADEEVIPSRFGNVTTYGIPGELEDYHHRRTGCHGWTTRAELLSDMTSFLDGFRPDKIYTTSAYDFHGDHVYLNHIIRDILRKLTAERPDYRPRMYEAIIHSTEDDVLWPERNDEDIPPQPFTPPAHLDATPLVWNDRISVPLTPDALGRNGLKSRCIRAYRSQYSGYIASFSKVDEIFWETDYDSPSHAPRSGSAPGERNVSDRSY